MGDKLKTKGNRNGKKKVTIVGENTSKVKTDSSGRPYVTVLESTTSVNKGDGGRGFVRSARFPPCASRVARRAFPFPLCALRLEFPPIKRCFSASQIGTHHEVITFMQKIMGPVTSGHPPMTCT